MKDLFSADTLNEHSRCQVRYFLDRLTDTRQGRRREKALCRRVEADHRKVLRNAHSPFTRLLEHFDRGAIVPGEYRSWTVGCIQQRLYLGKQRIAVGLPAHIDDPLGAQRHTGRAQGILVAKTTVLQKAFALTTRQMQDTRVAQTQKILGRHAPSEPVVAVDIPDIRVVVRTEHHDRRKVLFKQAFRHKVGGKPPEQCAVDAAISNRCDQLFRIDLLEIQVDTVTLPDRSPCDALHHLTGKTRPDGEVNRPLGNDPDRICAFARQPARQGVGTVVQFLGSLPHTATCLLGNPNGGLALIEYRGDHCFCDSCFCSDIAYRNCHILPDFALEILYLRYGRISKLACNELKDIPVYQPDYDTGALLCQGTHGFSLSIIGCFTTRIVQTESWTKFAPYTLTKAILPCYNPFDIPVYQIRCPQFAHLQEDRLMMSDTVLPRRYWIEQNGLSGFINQAGAAVVPPQYAVLGPFCEGRAAVKVNGKYGYLDAEGALVIEPEYDRAREFVEGLAAVQVGKRWGFIDLQGQMAIPLQYRRAWQFAEGLGLVELAGKPQRAAYIDASGQLALVSPSSRCGLFSEGLTHVSLRNHWGYFDKLGRLALEVEVTAADPFSEGLAGVLKGRKSGYIDRKGQFAIAPRFADAGRFSHGLAPVALGPNTNLRYGYIDKTGELVIPPRFSLAMPFSEGLAAALDAVYGWGYINATGEWGITPQYGLALPFEGPLAQIETRGRLGYINTSGATVWMAPAR